MPKKATPLRLALTGMVVLVATSATLAAQTLDEATRESVVEALAERLIDGYIYEEKGKELAADARRRLKAGVDALILDLGKNGGGGLFIGSWRIHRHPKNLDPDGHRRAVNGPDAHLCQRT